MASDRLGETRGSPARKLPFMTTLVPGTKVTIKKRQAGRLPYTQKEKILLLLQLVLKN